MSFYAKLPRGSAPETKPSGILGWYQRRFFSKGTAGRKDHRLFYNDIRDA